jgi:hypothetical protein
MNGATGEGRLVRIEEGSRRPCRLMALGFAVRLRPALAGEYADNNCFFLVKIIGTDDP